MTTLVALISSGKGTWAQVLSLISAQKWDKVYLICSEFAHENFQMDPLKATKLKIDETKPEQSYKQLAEFFKKEVKDFEVALNLFSGSGMEHMIVLDAILKAGLGIRMVYIDAQKQVKEFELLEQKFSMEEDDGFY